MIGKSTLVVALALFSLALANRSNNYGHRPSIGSRPVLGRNPGVHNVGTGLAGVGVIGGPGQFGNTGVAGIGGFGGDVPHGGSGLTGGNALVGGTGIFGGVGNPINVGAVGVAVGSGVSYNPAQYPDIVPGFQFVSSYPGRGAHGCANWCLSSHTSNYYCCTRTSYSG